MPTTKAKTSREARWPRARYMAMYENWVTATAEEAGRVRITDAAGTVVESGATLSYCGCTYVLVRASWFDDPGLGTGKVVVSQPHGHCQEFDAGVFGLSVEFT
jgi:hypothetical protein